MRCSQRPANTEDGPADTFPAQFAGQLVFAMTGQNKRQVFIRFAHKMPGRCCGQLQHLQLCLLSCCFAHISPFCLTKFTITVTVKMLEQRREVLLPLANQGCLYCLGVGRFVAATAGVEVTDCIERLACMQAFFGIAIASLSE